MLGYSSCLVLGVVLMCVGSSRGATIRFGQETSLEDSDEFKHVLRTLYDSFSHDVDSSKCSCNGFQCSCCVTSNIRFMKGAICFNATYVLSEEQIQLSFNLNHEFLFEMSISMQNAPPQCFSASRFSEDASICVDVYNMNYENKTLSGCAKMKVSLAFITVKEIDFGCFHFPLVTQEHMEKGKRLVAGIEIAKIYKAMLLDRI